MRERQTNFINSHDHVKFLGSSFINRQDEIILRIGTTAWTRTELVQKIGIAHMAAAARLSTTLRKAKVTSLEQLYALDPRELALTRGLGETTVFVVMAILHTEGFNASQWYEGAFNALKRVQTFRTLKLHGKRGGKRGRRGNN